MMMTAQKKPHIVIALPMLLRGGTEIQTLFLVRALVAIQYRVTVCCYFEYDAVVVHEFEQAGAEILLLKLQRIAMRANYKELFSLINKLRVVFRNLHPDALHIQYVAPGLAPIVAARLAGVNVIFATIHYPKHNSGATEKFFVHLASRLCTLFFCNSRATEESWFGRSQLFSTEHKHIAKKHCTLYNATDYAKINHIVSTTDREQMQESLGIAQQNVVGVVGRLREEKGHQFLFHALQMVIQKISNCVLVIVGDGPTRIQLQQLAKELNVHHHIVWLYELPHSEVIKYYSIMDVLVVPSQFEGFGLSAIEAMAAGVPVIASDVDGLKEVVEESSTGFRVPYNNTQALSNAIINVLTDKALRNRLSHEAQRRVHEQFDIIQYEKNIHTVYANAIL